MRSFSQWSCASASNADNLSLDTKLRPQLLELWTTGEVKQFSWGKWNDQQLKEKLQALRDLLIVMSYWRYWGNGLENKKPIVNYEAVCGPNLSLERLYRGWTAWSCGGKSLSFKILNLVVCGGLKLPGDIDVSSRKSLSFRGKILRVLRRVKFKVVRKKVHQRKEIPEYQKSA